MGSGRHGNLVHNLVRQRSVGQTRHERETDLHQRQVVGGHKPTRRWTTYLIFNIEMHCMAASKKELKRKEAKRRNANGIYLADIRGLSFHRTLERVAMLNLGKHKCLSYEEQAKEYEKELNAISLQVIKSTLQWWVNRRRVGLTQGGKKFPKLPIWSQNQTLYLKASEAACVARGSQRCFFKNTQLGSAPPLGLIF